MCMEPPDFCTCLLPICNGIRHSCCGKLLIRTWLLLLPIGIIIRLITTLISPFFLGSKSDILVPCIRQNTVALISHLPFGGNIRNQGPNKFSGRLRIWKEGWWKEWTPQIVLGANDPSTNDILGNSDKDDYGIGGVGEMGNGHWNRYYIAGTKHFYFKNRGELGIHVAYLYNKRKDYHLNGPAVGVNFHFYLSGTNFFVKALNNLNVMAEYDSRTINCGLKYSFWKDYINAVVEMTECKHLSGGVIFKVHLK